MQIGCRGKKICARGDITDRLFETGRRSLTHELNIVRIIRNQRMFESFIEDKLENREVRKLRYEAQQHVLRRFKPDGKPDSTVDPRSNSYASERNLSFDSITNVSH